MEEYTRPQLREWLFPRAPVAMSATFSSAPPLVQEVGLAPMVQPFYVQDQSFAREHAGGPPPAKRPALSVSVPSVQSVAPSPSVAMSAAFSSAQSVAPSPSVAMSDGQAQMVREWAAWLGWPFPSTAHEHECLMAAVASFDPAAVNVRSTV